MSNSQKNKKSVEAKRLRIASLFQQCFIFQNSGNIELAEYIYEQVLKLDPHHFDALHLYGTLAAQTKQWDKAIELLTKAIKVNKSSSTTYNNLGNVFNEVKRFDEALHCFEKAIEFNPKYADAYSNRGNVLMGIRLLEDALSSYNKAIEFNDNFASAYFNRAAVLVELKRIDEVISDFEKAYKLDPNIPFIKGHLFQSKMQICNWENYSELFESLNNDVEEGKLSANPFGYQGLCDKPDLLQKAAEIYTSNKYNSNALFPIEIKNINKKIKIGYLCGEFRNHATSILMINLWENHDNNKFEIIGLDNGWNDESEVRVRIEKSFDKLISIAAMSDLQAARLIKEERIDILINLNCFFGLQRNLVFSYRAAPIQVNYLGFPGTLGSDYMDYIIADKVVIPEYSTKFYSEKVVYLPNSYQVNDRLRVISEKEFTRKELGLPNEGFVFCCFNNNYKITPNTFDGWVRILKAVDNSVLWLFEDSPSASSNLKKEAQVRGLDSNRLVFAKRMHHSEHLARHRIADLFIDTLPYNAHTTASDALWAGLPVLTCMGESFASRVAASLLNAIELPELITTTQSEYEAKAIDLATNPEKLKIIKEKLERNRLNTALFDTPRFTKDIEAAYKNMYERYHSDLSPDHIFIKS